MRNFSNKFSAAPVFGAAEMLLDHDLDVERLELPLRLAGAGLKFDLLAFEENLAAPAVDVVGLDLRVVHEDFVLALLLDEAVALLQVEPLDSSCRHFNTSCG